MAYQDDYWWEPPFAGTEAQHVVSALERVRTKFRWKVEGLDKDGLNARLGVSTTTLGGLVKHLAAVEDATSTLRLTGEPIGAPWETNGWDGSNDWEFGSAADDSPEEIYALWDGAVARSRVRLTAALAEGGLDRLVHRTWLDGSTYNLRRLLGDLIEEYARHTGHADMLREAIDGRAGVYPPAGWQPGGSGVR
jgi:hypothetical protein